MQSVSMQRRRAECMVSVRRRGESKTRKQNLTSLTGTKFAERVTKFATNLYL
jgi:hypothetical protein